MSGLKEKAKTLEQWLYGNQCTSLSEVMVRLEDAKEIAKEIAKKIVLWIHEMDETVYLPCKVYYMTLVVSGIQAG